MRTQARTPIWQGILMIGISVLSTLLCVEIAFRLFYHPEDRIAENHQVLVHQSSDNLKLLYHPIPNAAGEVFGTINRINSYGFRDKEYPVERQDGVPRIVFLGDSVVYGYALANNEGISEQLEGLYAEKGKEVEVLNMGVSGYDTEQAVEFYKMVGRQFRPDIVILGYCLNDSIYASLELDFFNDREHWKLKNNDFGWEKKLMYWVYQSSRLVQYLDHEKHLFDSTPKLQMAMRGEKTIWHYIRDRNVKNRDSLGSEYQQLKYEILKEAEKVGATQEVVKKSLGFIGIDNDEIYSSHWNVSRRALRELIAVGKEDGFRLIVMIIPYMLDLERYVLGPAHDFLFREIMAAGAEVVDLLPMIQEAYHIHGQSIKSHDPVHFSADGARVVAEYIFSALVDLP